MPTKRPQARDRHGEAWSVRCSQASSSTETRPVVDEEAQVYPGTYAASAPDRVALIMAGTGETVTYAQLEERSRRLVHVLRAAGLRRGDVIAILSDNDPRVLEIYWAAQRCGLYVSAINHNLAPAEVRYILGDSGAQALFTSARNAGLATAAAPEDLELRWAFGGEVDRHADYEAALTAAPDAPLDEQPRGADMLYSSGTTGRPKGIKPPLPDREVDEPGDALVAVFGERYGFDEETVYLSPAPLYHAAPLRTCITVQSVGGTVVVMDRFDAESSLELIDRFRVTHSQWVPTMFVRMLKLPDSVRERYDVSSMQVAIHAAAPCPVSVKQQMIAWWGPVLEEYYAATEVNGMTMISSDEWLRKPGSVGRATIGVVRICDEEGRELPTGEVGTVFFERDVVAFEYHNDPDKTRQAQHPEHETWTTVGDLGYLDEDGYLFLTDRKAFMIISGGVNIYPQEVEDVLALHPAVYDVAVIGVPDDEMGEQVKAVIVPAVGAEPGLALEAEIIAYVRERIARYKVPRSVDFREELPRTPTGKLVKGELRAEYV
jgi:long-chain acyl-CoA synthetase